MIFFNKSVKERESIRRYHQCYEDFIKKYENFQTLQKNVSKIKDRYERQISNLESKRKSLHDSNSSILKTKSTIYMIAYPKEMSKEEYDNFLLYQAYIAKINELKAKIARGYEINMSYDEKESTTYMFTFQTTSVNQNYKIYSTLDKLKFSEEIKALESKIEQFSGDQINFFENKLGWQRDIEKRLKRLVQFEDEHASIKTSIYQQINDMRKTKTELADAKKNLELYYNSNLKDNKETLNKLYSSFSKNAKKELKKKQNSIDTKDFSM